MEARIAHIHGFNSGPASETLRKIQVHFPLARALSYPCSGFFSANFQHLLQQIDALPGSGPLVLTGSSLGGFYAAQLGAYLGCPCAMFNPAVEPAKNLGQFLGPNTNIHTGEVWTFTAAMQASYESFPDPRRVSLRRLLVLGRNDNLLDPSVARAYWQGHAVILETDDDHAIARVDARLVVALQALTGDEGPH